MRASVVEFGARRTAEEDAVRHVREAIFGERERGEVLNDERRPVEVVDNGSGDGRELVVLERDGLQLGEGRQHVRLLHVRLQVLDALPGQVQLDGQIALRASHASSAGPAASRPSDTLTGAGRAKDATLRARPMRKHGRARSASHSEKSSAWAWHYCIAICLEPRVGHLMIILKVRGGLKYNTLT